MRFLWALMALGITGCFSTKTNVDSPVKTTIVTPIATGTSYVYTPTPGVSPTSNPNIPCYQRRGVPSTAKPLANNDFGTLTIIAPGKGNSTGVVQPSWSSSSLSEKGFLTTDSFHTYRISVMDAPGVNGASCRFYARYGALDVTIGVKVPGSSSYTSTYTFRRAKLNACQTSPKLRTPTALSGPPQVDILNVNWDRCNSGYNDPEIPRTTPPAETVPCPMNPVWLYDCFQLQLDVATDYTYDIPT